MKLAITPNNHNDALVLYDTETGNEQRISNPLPEKECRPFGITWNKDHIFVASKYHLLVFDSDLELVDIYRDILDYNTHQITIHGDELVVCMTTKDCLKYINLKDFSHRYWHPKFGWLDKPKVMPEMYHLNTVVSYKGNIHVMLHNRGVNPSKIVCGEQVTALEAIACHGLYLDGDTTGYVHTKAENVVLGEQVISHQAWKGWFLRGLAGDDKELVVGASNFKLLRADRPTGDSVLSIIKEGKVQNHCILKNFGDVDDIRRIDGPDFCHHNPHPFPHTKF